MSETMGKAQRYWIEAGNRLLRDDQARGRQEWANLALRARHALALSKGSDV